VSFHATLVTINNNVIQLPDNGFRFSTPWPWPWPQPVAMAVMLQRGSGRGTGRGRFSATATSPKNFCFFENSLLERITIEYNFFLEFCGIISFWHRLDLSFL
jgi:hypothetical protein